MHLVVTIVAFLHMVKQVLVKATQFSDMEKIKGLFLWCVKNYLMVML